MNANAWLTRAKHLLSMPASSSETVQFAASFLTAIYGPESVQLTTFTRSLDQVAKSAPNPSNAGHHQFQQALGVIRNTVAEIEGGLIGSLRAQVAGEVFAELVGLGKEILQEDTEAAKNVSAVLIAAAFEDIMRRMGTELAGVTARPELQEVLTALKTAGVLKGGEVGTAQSFLKF